MTSRRNQIDRFLQTAGWSPARRTMVTGDLSARSYVRLVRDDGTTAILMDAPPDKDSSTPAFARMTGWLDAVDLSVPGIMAQDVDNGLLLLEDLGTTRVSDLVCSDPTKRAEIYDICLDLLLHIRRQSIPPLARPDARTLVEMTSMADEYYPGIRPTGILRLKSILENVFDDILADGVSVSLRDFHVDNLMWLPGRSGLRRLGLLDYQDAFLVHPVYDLVSLLTDARADIEPDFRLSMISEYARRAGDSQERLNLAFAAFSVQRNLRILGIFSRAASQLGRPHHLPKLPRVHDYLSEALQHPVFAAVREEALNSIPAPKAEFTARLA